MIKDKRVLCAVMCEIDLTRKYKKRVGKCNFQLRTKYLRSLWTRALEKPFQGNNLEKTLLCVVKLSSLYDIIFCVHLFDWLQVHLLSNCKNAYLKYPESGSTFP